MNLDDEILVPFWRGAPFVSKSRDWTFKNLWSRLAIKRWNRSGPFSGTTVSPIRSASKRSKRSWRYTNTWAAAPAAATTSADRRARRTGLVNCPGQRQWKENTRVSGTSPGLVNPKGTAFPSLITARDCQPSPAGGRRYALARTDPPQRFFLLDRARPVCLRPKCRRISGGWPPTRACGRSLFGKTKRGPHRALHGGERRSKGAGLVFAAGGNGAERTLRRRQWGAHCRGQHHMPRPPIPFIPAGLRQSAAAASAPGNRPAASTRISPIFHRGPGPGPGRPSPPPRRG